MVSPDVYLLFVGGSVLLMLSPGPDILYILTRSVAQNRKAELMAMLGANAGAYIYLFAAIVGLSAILATSALAFTVVKVIDACYLIWLVLNTIFSKAGPVQINKSESKVYSDRLFSGRGFYRMCLIPR